MVFKKYSYNYCKKIITKFKHVQINVFFAKIEVFFFRLTINFILTKKELI